MLNCGLCNYYKNVNSNTVNKSICMCEFTGFIFHKQPEEYEMKDHPCYEYEINKGTVKTEKVITVNEKEAKSA